MRRLTPLDPIRIFLCLDDVPRRALIRAVLGACSDVVVVGEDVAEEPALDTAQGVHPDVVVIAGRSRFAAARLVGVLRDRLAGVQVVALAPVEYRPRTLAARSLVADRYIDPGLGLADACSAIVEFARARRALSVAFHARVTSA